ncbi:MAG: NADH-quinone oxidoreductase subunit A [Acidobacteria bacterium]|nr:NADH-quinone oxidoreductase subunit A [Acidobacteriota bacterium]
MTQNSLGLVVLLVFALATATGMVVLSAIAGPRRKRLTDMTPYEGGSKPFESARKRFSVRFYLIAMLFILFDVEAVFLYPWAIELRNQAAAAGGSFVFNEMLVFIGVLVVGFAYAWGRGALEWDR